MRITGIGINADAGYLDGEMKKLRSELEYFTELGFSHVEIAPHGVGAIYNGQLNQARVDEVRSILEDHPLKCTVHGPNPMNLMNRDDIITEKNMFLASIDFAAQVGAELMVYHAGRFLPEERFLLPQSASLTARDKIVMWNLERALLKQMGDVAGERGVTIAVENARPYLDAFDYSYGEKLESLAIMVSEVNHPQVGITLDVGHAYLSACHYKYDLLSAVDRVSSMVRHVHLHDNFGKACASYEKRQYELAAAGRGDMHMPPGWGSVPVREAFDRLETYSGVITLELRPRYRVHYGEALDYTSALVAVDKGMRSSRTALREQFGG